MMIVVFWKINSIILCDKDEAVESYYFLYKIRNQIICTLWIKGAQYISNIYYKWHHIQNVKKNPDKSWKYAKTYHEKTKIMSQ